MLYDSPLSLYADEQCWNDLKIMQLHWQSRGEEQMQWQAFYPLINGKIEYVTLLLHWLNKPLPFEAAAMARLMSARAEDGTNLFSESFINFLQRFRFYGEIWLMNEGTPVFKDQPIIQTHSSLLHGAILQLWIQYLIKPDSYLVKPENLLQMRRFYDKAGNIIQDIIFSPDTPPIVNFEAASWEDLLQIVYQNL
ncbi:MAG: hypothetical protein ACK4TA_19545 [Saprospiraceae bacterium]